MVKKPRKQTHARSAQTASLRIGKAIRFFFTYLRTHKAMAAGGVFILVIAALVGAYQYADYREQFSLKDYESLSATAQSVLTTSGGGEITEERECHYSATGVYQQPRLFCSVRMVSYVTYESDTQASDTGKRFGDAIAKSFANHETSYLSMFYDKPDNSAATATVDLQSPYPPSWHCNFYIRSNQKAQSTFFFKRRTEDNLIALAFECSTTSREQYFPVVDR